MLSSKFNKIGDTAFRAKSQIVAYSNLLNFLIEENEEIIKIKDKEELDEKIKKWAREEDIYFYSENDKLNRSSIILNVFRKKMMIIENNNHKIQISQNIKDEFKNCQNVEEFFFKYLYKNYAPFKEIINFAFNYEKKVNIDFLIISFLVFENEEKENVQYIYETIERLGIDDFMKFLSKKYLESLNKNNHLNLVDSFFNSYRKKSENQHSAHKLLIKKIENHVFSYSDINILDNKKSSDLIKAAKNEKLELQDFLNKYNIDEIIERISYIKIKTLLNKEYKDLFKRWLSDLNLIDKNTFDKTHLKMIQNEIYWTKKEEENIKYPYNIEKIKKYLLCINQNNFSFKRNEKYLIDIGNSVIAEYFTNLFYAFKFDIAPKDFSIYSRTKLLSGTLYPVMTAPGGGADMYYYSDNVLYIVETTIHKSLNQIINHEANPIARHSSDSNIIWIKNLEKYNEVINLICYLDKENEIKKTKELLSENLKIEINQNNNNKIKDVSINVYNFENLK
ncbi:MAG: hypothetical protein ACRCRZ_02560 [Metamycoplasmataceae bacterium]